MFYYENCDTWALLKIVGSRWCCIFGYIPLFYKGIQQFITFDIEYNHCMYMERANRKYGWFGSLGNAIYHAFSIQFVNFYALHQIYTYPHFLKLVFVCVVIFSMLHFAGMTAILFSGWSHVMYLILSTTNWTRILNFKLQSMLIYLDVGFRNSFYIKTLLYMPDSGTLWLFNVFVFFFIFVGF